MVYRRMCGRILHVRSGKVGIGLIQLAPVPKRHNDVILWRLLLVGVHRGIQFAPADLARCLDKSFGSHLLDEFAIAGTKRSEANVGLQIKSAEHVDHDGNFEY